MGRNKTLIAAAPVVRILKEHGIPRVSKRAAQEITEHIEERAQEIAVRARELAEHSGRQTVMGEDIRLAIKDAARR